MEGRLTTELVCERAVRHVRNVTAACSGGEGAKRLLDAALHRLDAAKVPGTLELEERTVSADGLHVTVRRRYAQEVPQ